MSAAGGGSGLEGRLTIDLGAIVRNWRGLDQISGGALTGAVIKADAYGLGISRVARALHGAGARFFFVATPDEALTLRATLRDAYVFVLDGVYPGAARLYAAERLMPVISSLPMLEEWLRLCLDRNEALPSAFHFDTGMNRLGFRMQDASIVRSRCEELGYEPQMIMSHLACADTPGHEKNRTQVALFNSLLGQFGDIPASLANSAGILMGREAHFQLVRPGIALFGGRAVGGRPNPMAPVVKLEVPVLQVREARTGETVGYGATHTLARDSRLAILGIGYADGFLRSLSGSHTRAVGRAVIRGHVVPLVGRVSMDLCAVDITDLGRDIPDPGEMAEVLGAQVTIDDQADAAGTIGYEILTSLKGRYARAYKEVL